MLRITVVGVIVGCAALGACLPNMHLPSDEDVSILASDAHVMVGGVRLVLPVAALPQYKMMAPFFVPHRGRESKAWVKHRNEFQMLAPNPKTAPTLDKLQVVIDNYGGHGWDRLCPALKREWAKSVCDGPPGSLRQALPESFYLANSQKLETFDNHFTVGHARRSDQLRVMTLGSDASVVCDVEVRTTRFCTAAIALEYDLIAVWTVWDGDKETSTQQAIREGQAIAAFVSHALGPTENFPGLIERICNLRRPGSAPFPGLPDPCAT